MRVTWMSVLTSAFAILLAFLIIVRLIQIFRGPEENELAEWMVYGSALVGSLTLAFPIRCGSMPSSRKYMR